MELPYKRILMETRWLQMQCLLMLLFPGHLGIQGYTRTGNTAVSETVQENPRRWEDGQTFATAAQELETHTQTHTSVVGSSGLLMLMQIQPHFI